jgi:hypothetical protein
MRVPRASRVSSRWWLAGLALAALVVVAAALLASGDPDGLERVAIDHGFAERAEDAPFTLIPDYVLPGFDGPLATILAGLVGVVVVFGLIWLVGRFLVRRPPESNR